MNEMQAIEYANICGAISPTIYFLSNIVFPFTCSIFNCNLEGRGEAKNNFLWIAQPQFADKQTTFEPNLPANRTFLELCQQFNVGVHYLYSANVPTS